MTYKEFEKIYPPFRKLRDRHFKLFQVDWCIQYADADNEISFWSFRREGRWQKTEDGYYNKIPDPRYKGLGHACFQDVIDLADSFGLSIWLFCEVPKLYTLYESFGFVCIKQVRRRREYRRQPKTKGEIQCAISKSTS